MSTENIQEVTPNETQSEKKFSQAELDAIISERLKRDREKYSDYEALKEKAARLDEIEEKNKTELERATERATRLEAELNGMKKRDEITAIRDKVAKETGFDASLLTADTEEECRNQAQAFMNWHKANPTTYPTVKDGGEVINYSGKANRDKFADWLDSVAQ